MDEDIVSPNSNIGLNAIQQVFCVGINLHDYTMSLSLQVLKPLAADFDKFSMNFYQYIGSSIAVKVKAI